MVKDHKRKAILHFELYATFFSGVVCLVILAGSGGASIFYGHILRFLLIVLPNFTNYFVTLFQSMEEHRQVKMKFIIIFLLHLVIQCVFLFSRKKVQKHFFPSAYIYNYSNFSNFVLHHLILMLHSLVNYENSYKSITQKLSQQYNKTALTFTVL